MAVAKNIGGNVEGAIDYKITKGKVSASGNVSKENKLSVTVSKGMSVSECDQHIQTIIDLSKESCGLSGNLLKGNIRRDKGRN